jgi:hypothetical protein
MLPPSHEKYYSRAHTGCQVDYTLQKAPNEWKEGENLVKIPGGLHHGKHDLTLALSASGEGRGEVPSPFTERVRVR